MTNDDILKVARECGYDSGQTVEMNDTGLITFARRIAAAERKRIVLAIKAEDDYCVDEGDYMLDSNDCISIAIGTWRRPDYSVDTKERKR